MPRLLLLAPIVLFGCVAAPEATESPLEAPPAPLGSEGAVGSEGSADPHGAFAHLDAQRIDAWWTEIDGERGTATVAVRASTASDNTYVAEVRALFGAEERAWRVEAPAVAAGEIFEVAVPLGAAGAIDPQQADYTTELLVQVRAYGPGGVLRDTRPLPVRHLLVERGVVHPLTEAERASVAPRGVRADLAARLDPAAAPAGSTPENAEEPGVETRVLPTLAR